MEKNLNKERLEKEVADELGIDRRIVTVAGNHPFLFFKTVSQNKDEIRPVMLRYFGKFILKNNAQKL